MSQWTADEPYDGIWCCASLLHLQDSEIESFFDNLRNNLKPGGVLFLSVKEGNGHFIDEDGRYMRLFTEQELRDRLIKAGINVIEQWNTQDNLHREEVQWINVICRM